MEKEKSLKVLADRIHSSGGRMTEQRKVVLEELSGVTTHPRAEELYRIVRKRLPEISFGTVYRNLRTLIDLGLVQELKFGEDFSRFDANVSPHQHFSCMKCKKIYDLMFTNPGLDKKVSQKTGFKVLYSRVEFYGLCSNCK